MRATDAAGARGHPWPTARACAWRTIPPGSRFIRIAFTPISTSAASTAASPHTGSSCVRPVEVV